MAYRLLLTMLPWAQGILYLRPGQQCSSVEPGDEIEYEFLSLVPSTAYEVRVSVKGTSPVAVGLAFRSEKNARHLLDTEKLTFVTDQAGRPSNGPRIVLTLERIGTATSELASTLHLKPVPFCVDVDGIEELYAFSPSSMVGNVCLLTFFCLALVGSCLASRLKSELEFVPQKRLQASRKCV